MSDVDKLSESTGKEILFFWQILFYGILSNIWWWCRTGKKRRKKNTFKSTENPKNSTRRLISRQKTERAARKGYIGEKIKNWWVLFSFFVISVFSFHMFMAVSAKDVCCSFFLLLLNRPGLCFHRDLKWIIVTILDVITL
jgi:hypothetical protein